ncbi:MAG: hypothetical protein ACJAQ6_000465 [Arenicella sp.]|jgi:hypothetical protein
MNLFRQRAQQQFPSVLLTLLSIVQAIALELLWGHVQETNYVMEFTVASVVAVLQVFATLFCIVLVWISYASTVMRFRWTPSTADSVYPFLIGLLQFVQIEMLGPELLGQWTILLAIIFAVMVLVTHFMMRRARLSGDNGAFFDGVTPAKIRNFLPQIMVVVLLMMGGVYVWVTSDAGVYSILLLIAVLAVLVQQYVSTTLFWSRSMQADEK